MTPEGKAQVVKLSNTIKSEIRDILDKHATEASQLAVKSDDPHVPVIGWLQMALVNAATEYLITCGCQPIEAVQLTVDVTGKSMNAWINSLNSQKPELPQTKVEGKNDN